MPTRLRLLNLLLALVACLLVLGAVRELVASRPLPPAPAARPARPAATDALSADPSMPGGYDVIAAKNLFSPSRTEAPPTAAVAAGPKPTLHGVVMDGTRSRAYLEDPAQKRTFGYTIGDPVGGGRVASIAADRVLIDRGGGAAEVLLRDPAKPRPSGPAAPAPAQAGAPSAGQPPAATPAPAPPSPAAGWPDAPAAGPTATPAARGDR